ncbi:serine hydrolase domain-containing protein [Parvularcula oceani]|uniref:serine hydrolase domain-containing protein n=1 Tax=Parvularcula oceani TaxID=1247963 RepID=UPI0004E14579|nr:serine hydrolase domain-containing protein [Parvularcula oceani]
MQGPHIGAIALFMAALGGSAAAQNARPSALPPDAVPAAAREATGAPAAAIIVTRPDGPVFIASDGSRIAGGDAAPGPGDPWHVGSNAKAMTATLALALEAEGAIALPDSVLEVLGRRFEVHEAWGAVTLEDLLRHEGGVQPNADRLTMMRYILAPTEDAAGAQEARRAVLRRLLKAPPKGRIGEFAYSNLGYTLAGEMLSAAGGAPYETLMEEKVFGPLGMEGVVLGAPGPIRGHKGRPAKPSPKGADNPAFMAPAGTWSLPLHAYAAFLTDQLRGQMDLPGTLLPLAAYDAMATSRPGSGYGLGWGVTADGSLIHSGSNTMWFATARIMPEAGEAAAILTNSGEPLDWTAILEAAARQ